MRRQFIVMLAIAGLPLAAAGAHMERSASRPQHVYKTESGAHRHCPADQVVWLNTDTGTYHAAGARYYAHTKHGAYVCSREAQRAGDRMRKNMP